MPHLLNIHMNIFQGRGDNSVPQQVLEDVKVALGLLHQIGSDRMPKADLALGAERLMRSFQELLGEVRM